MGMSQISDVLRYMQENENGITSKEAFNLFGATRLSGLIFHLKKQGYAIVSEREVVQDRYGKSVSIARYKIIG